MLCWNHTATSNASGYRAYRASSRPAPHTWRRRHVVDRWRTDRRLSGPPVQPLCGCKIHQEHEWYGKCVCVYLGDFAFSTMLCACSVYTTLHHWSGREQVGGLALGAWGGSYKRALPRSWSLRVTLSKDRTKECVLLLWPGKNPRQHFTERYRKIFCRTLISTKWSSVLNQYKCFWAWSKIYW